MEIEMSSSESTAKGKWTRGTKMTASHQAAHLVARCCATTRCLWTTVLWKVLSSNQFLSQAQTANGIVAKSFNHKAVFKQLWAAGRIHTIKHGVHLPFSDCKELHEGGVLCCPNAILVVSLCHPNAIFRYLYANLLWSRGNPCTARALCATFRLNSPPQEPPGKPLGNALRIM